MAPPTLQASRDPLAPGTGDQRPAAHPPTHSLANLPASVSAERWESLCRAAELAELQSSLEDPSLRAGVVSVVRELRAAGESWDVIYGALSDIVALPCDGSVRAPSEYELYSSRGAALVAQMQSWADVERLEELAQS